MCLEGLLAHQHVAPTRSKRLSSFIFLVLRRLSLVCSGLLGCPLFWGVAVWVVFGFRWALSCALEEPEPEKEKTREEALYEVPSQLQARRLRLDFWFWNCTCRYVFRVGCQMCYGRIGGKDSQHCCTVSRSAAVAQGVRQTHTPLVLTTGFCEHCCSMLPIVF